ncbi:MAG: hypothetical protein PF542_00165 [Nanoarchaeota archaeon]|jgi:hypothetical protein|nr:hypothetical protein [Nanoarchaeota archaeon]
MEDSENKPSTPSRPAPFVGKKTFTPNNYPPRVQSEAEKKVRSLTQLYYSRQDIQKAMFDFSKNREISPRFFEGFGKRPDTFQFPGDVYGMVKKGATSFHCSEEIWSDPMEIETGMSKEAANKIRTGWDLLIDIDCEEGMDYSARVAKATIQALRENGIKNIGLKFSGSKGFHVIVPWGAFPKNINGTDTSAMFPQLPRMLMAFLRDYSRKLLNPMLPADFYERFKDKIKERYRCKQCGEFVEEYLKVEFSCERCNITEERTFKGGKGTLPKCYKCKENMKFKPIVKLLICNRCEIRGEISPSKLSKKFEKEEVDMYALMGLDMGLVSPRHLFRMPYSLHEKSSLASVVLEEEDLDKFIEDPNCKERIADPLRVIIKNFMPNPEENEAAELVMQAYDWASEAGYGKEEEKRASGKYAEFKAVKLENLEEGQFPPCVKKILEGGMLDGKKRALFVLINFFRSIGLSQEELEKKLGEWNEKNEEPLQKSYIHSQLTWTYRRKPLMPPNCRDFYNDLGVCSPDATCQKIKNPINYTLRKNFVRNNLDSNNKYVSPHKDSAPSKSKYKAKPKVKKNATPKPKSQSKSQVKTSYKN